MSKTHTFSESLERSHRQADAPWWDRVYRIAFPSFASSVNVSEDGWAQRGGIDRVITLKSGRTITVDEKVREKDWNDILLERWSDQARKIPGWVQKPLACEFIAYAFVPSTRCYLLPTLTLQRAWRDRGRDWCKRYDPVIADNGHYKTESVPIPIPELMEALTGAMIVNWGGEIPDAVAA